MLTADQIDYAAGLRHELPVHLLEALREPAGASAIILAQLLSNDVSIRTMQIQKLRKDAAPAVFEGIEKLSPLVHSLKPSTRIPLVDWALTALRSLSESQYEQFRALVNMLIEADNQVDLFEFCLQRMLRRNLDTHFYSLEAPSVIYSTTQDVLQPALELLSILAWTGNSTETEASEAFLTGARQLNLSAQHDFALRPQSESTDWQRMDQVLEELSRSGLYVRKNLLFACAHTVASDGKIMEPERELLRAVADSLDLPVPPFVRELARHF